MMFTMLDGNESVFVRLRWVVPGWPSSGIAAAAGSQGPAGKLMRDVLLCPPPSPPQGREDSQSCLSPRVAKER